jgi:hypothetical protein
MSTIMWGFVFQSSAGVILTSTELTGATAPTVNISRTMIADGTTIAAVVTGGALVYDANTKSWSYQQTGADLATYFYRGMATTTYATALPLSVHAFGMVIPDGLLSPVALDGGAATIGGMLAKMADDNGGASFDATTNSLAKLSAAIVTGTPSQIYASANTLERGTARQATTPWATGGVASTFADTGATDTAYLACSPLNSTATINGIANITMWQTLTFLAGAARANYVSTVGYHTGGASPRVVDAYYYDYVTTTWKLLTSTSNRMNNAAADATYGPWYLPAAAQKNQTAGDGEVKIAFVSSGTNVNDILHANLVFLSASIAGPSASDIAEAVYGRMLPVTVDGVWLDTVNGVDGSEGNATSPVLTIAGAYARCAALNLKRIYFKAGSNAVPVALTQSAAGWRFVGPGVIDIAGMSIADAVFEDCYTISNTGAADGDDAKFSNCGMGNGPFRHGYWWHCQMKNVTGITLTAGDEYHFFDCKDSTPEAGDPATFIFAAGADLNLRDYQGGVQIKSMATNDTAKLDGALRLVVHSSSTGGAITLRGNGPVPTIASQFTAGGGTVNDDALYNVQQVNAEADLALSDYDPPTNTEFEARTLPSADYVIVSDLPAVPSTADIKLALEIDGGKLDHLWETTADDGGVRRFTTNALELAPVGTSLDAAGIRGAIGMAAANLDAQLTALPTDLDVQAAAAAALLAYGVALETTLTAIKGVGWTTETLTALGAMLTAIGNKTTNLPSDPADESQVEAAIAASEAAILAAIVPVIPGAAPTLADIRAAIITDHGVGSYQRESGVGILTYVYTVTDSVSGLPLDGVYVWVTLANDSTEDPPQASGYTIAAGTVSFHLDPGWYYFWKQIAGHDAPTADYLEVSNAP